ncbi:hypothetical protein [Arsenicicoccus piscis]|uniref:DUF2613 domain-containing protein n=1 Tax=Arsenicicoccus piscis TaxID=673954 RepID=A0ABQ6HWQ8_9MICO|nr:hypothetical protein [Arsenicicoccus piscis]GMA19699.1 hypothetical protein GCM10025862_17200 [Arsenicicoccus piscis]GMA21964.1 hypothetical protein GCM10025862_39850 [Arsenicicoccus piscis]
MLQLLSGLFAGRALVALITAGSVLLGGGAATIAVKAIGSAKAPDDSSAVRTGPKHPVDPAQIISYGG